MKNITYTVEQTSSATLTVSEEELLAIAWYYWYRIVIFDFKVIL